MQILWSQFHFSPNDPNLLLLVSGQWKPNRQHYCVDPVARRASGWLPWPILCWKFCIFLGYIYERPIFGLGRTRLNAIISLSYPEETLDSFSFTVGGRLAGRFSTSGPDFGHFGPLPNCYNIITLNFGPWLIKLGGTIWATKKKWPMFTTDLVLVGITEKRPFYPFAEKRKTRRKSDSPPPKKNT